MTTWNVTSNLAKHRKVTTRVRLETIYAAEMIGPRIARRRSISDGSSDGDTCRQWTSPIFARATLPLGGYRQK